MGHAAAAAAAAHVPLGAITVDDLLAAGVAGGAAAELHEAVRRAVGAHARGGDGGAAAVWGELCRAALRPGVPFAVHRMLYYGCFAGFPSATPPAWTPDP